VIKELLIQYKQIQVSKTHRSRSKYGDISHRLRGRHEEGYYPNTELYKQPYSPNKEVSYNSYIVKQYSSSFYTRKDSKREGYSSKSHSREKTSQKVSFVDSIVPSYTLKTSFPSPSLISSLPNKDILPISPYPLNFYDHS